MMSPRDLEDAVAADATDDRLERAQRNAETYRQLCDSAQLRNMRLIELGHETIGRLRAIEALHVQSNFGAHERCRHCRHPWPCDTAKIVNPGIGA